jgi:hypothetical protein
MIASDGTAMTQALFFTGSLLSGRRAGPASKHILLEGKKQWLGPAKGGVFNPLRGIPQT